MRLDAILEWEMDELQAKAYKLCMIWIERSRKVFPDYQHMKMKQGDPRKSLTWKLCFKLIRETQGVLEETDYPLYVRAQLEVLKKITTSKGFHPNIDANCLHGEQAWKRWKLWKKRYDTISQKPSEISQVSAPGIDKALQGLESTKEFLVKAIGAEPNLEKYQEIYLNKNIFRWINFGKISPYYLAMSPHIAKTLKPDDLKKINFDPEVYKPCITKIVVAKFKELFPHEK